MAGRHHGPETVRAANVPKVPDVNPWFWAVKVLTTAMGEAVSDFSVKEFNPYLAVFCGFVVFALALTWQFRVPDYRTWPYWTAVSMVAVFGTMVADAMHVGLGIPYKVSVTLFAVSLAVVLFVWYRTERTLSIHSITTRRREVFYWLTVCCTFALGTATGDLTATTLHLGYFTSGVVFTLAILIPLVAWRLGVNPVLTFWVAYILTRPIGASFADFFGMPKSSGGLGIGHGPVSLVTVVLVVACVAYLAKTGKDQPTAADLAAAAEYAPPAGGGYGPPQPAYAPAPPPGYAAQQPPPPGYRQQPPPGYRQQPPPGYRQQPPPPGRGPSFTPGPGYEQGQDYDPYRGAPRRD